MNIRKLLHTLSAGTKGADTKHTHETQTHTQTPYTLHYTLTTTPPTHPSKTVTHHKTTHNPNKH